MSVLKRTFAILACLLFAAAASAAGQRVLSSKQSCRMTVPANWKINGMSKSVANAPDGSMTALISTSGDDTSLAMAKSVMTSSYPPVKTFEDSPQPLMYEYEQPGGKYQFGIYSGAPGENGTVCGAQISFKNVVQLDAAKQIAVSVSPAS